MDYWVVYCFWIHYKWSCCEHSCTSLCMVLCFFLSFLKILLEYNWYTFIGLFFAAKDGETIQSAKTRLGADCSSDHELLIAKFRHILKKLGKTTRPFTYDLNQIPYKYTVEMTNKFKGLDLIDRVPEELWTEVLDSVQDAVNKITLKKRECKKENGCLRRP